MKFQTVRAAEGWETLSSETRYADPHLAVASVHVRTPAKPSGRRWTVVHRKAAVVIAPMTRNGELVLIKEERVPIQAALWAVPAGQIDEPHEHQPSQMEAVARRELQEETGYELAPDGQLIPLGHYFTSAGMTDECGHLYLARPVQPGDAGSAHTESESILDCRAFSHAQVAEMIARNEIRDSNTLSICAVLAARGYFSLGG